MQVGSPPAQRSLRISFADLAMSPIDVAIFENVEPSALRAAVASRVSLADSGFFLTLSTERSGMVIPLSASIPDGTALVLHRTVLTEVDAVAPPPAMAMLQPTPPTIAGTMLTPLLVQPPNREPINSSVVAPASEPMMLEASSSSSRSAPSAHRPEVVSNQLDGLERLSRMSTDLANERTLLAWTRTCLAAIRTTFTYLELSGTTVGWLVSVKVSEVMTAVLVVATAFTGAW